MWGKGLRGNNATFSALAPLPVTSPATHKQIVPFWCWFLGGWDSVCSRTLGAPPTDSPVRLAVSPIASTPTGIYSQRYRSFPSQHWNPGLHGLSPQLFLVVYLHTNVRFPSPPATALPRVLSAQLPISAPPASLDECLFFNTLVVRLPYSLILGKFWLFFVFKLAVVLLLVVRGSEAYLPMPPSWPEA